MNARFRATVLTGILALASACSKGDSTAPPKPASIAAGTTTTLAGTVGAALAAPPTFVVRDAGGNALDNVAVTILVTAGGGVLTGAPTKSSGGPTSVGTWTLGTAAGTNVLTVTVSGLPPLTFTAAGAPGAPSALSVVSGNNQSAPAGTQVAQSISFKVADTFGNGVPNTPVAFQVSAGEGVLSGAPTVTTDLNGVANTPLWTLGKINIPQQVSATAGSLSGTATASISSLYQAVVRFFGPTPDPNYAAAFTRAVNKINAEITGQLSPVTFSNYDIATACGITGVSPLSESVPAMIVYVTIKPIDGVGRILASSGPCLIRDATAAAGRQLTVVGTMTFDVADVQQLFNNGQLNDVALHEIQHVIGFGTLWNYVNPPLIINAGTVQTAFTGALGRAACQQLGGSQADCLPGVLLENTGGAGTADGHWRRTIFTPELMVGYIAHVGTPMPLSAMTIEAQADLGYIVNTNVADAYSVPSSVASLLATVRAAQGLAVEDQRDELLLPRFQVTGSGKVTKLK
jgi:hypothetical protein